MDKPGAQDSEPASQRRGAQSATPTVTQTVAQGVTLRATPPAARRLFIALWPPPATRRRLRAWLPSWAWPPHAAVVPPERLHVTLHFLGPVAESRLANLGEALRVPAANLEPFELHFDRVAFWPHGLVVLGPTQVPAALEILHARLAETLRALGLPVEARPFRPHLTLARKAAGAVAPAAAPDIRWPVAGYSLVQSAGGYRTLRHYGRAAAP